MYEIKDYIVVVTADECEMCVQASSKIGTETVILIVTPAHSRSVGPQAQDTNCDTQRQGCLFDNKI